MFTSKLPFKIGNLAIVLMLALVNAQPAYAQPSNDNFADAIVITSLPASVSGSNYEATFEPGEPISGCGNQYSPGTIWYAYTPLTDESLTAELPWGEIPSVLGIYTASLDSLSPIGCIGYYNKLTFQAKAGVAYYFQLSGWEDWYQGMMTFNLYPTPPPEVYIYYNPFDPSIFDDVIFNSYIYDQYYLGTYFWNLGDGTTSDQENLTHRYTKDGDYAVNLTYTTGDGRTGNANTTVQVRTRDVAVTKFTVPQTVKSNTTKEITVEVTNRRYSDNVQVQLYKGLPGGGEQLIGTLTIFVPARATRATLFKFSYTFTGCDATVGKVTFRTAATLMSGRDALPADNTAIRTTLVSGAKGPCAPSSYP